MPGFVVYYINTGIVVVKFPPAGFKILILSIFSIGQILFHIGNESMKMGTSQDFRLCSTEILLLWERC